MDKPQSIVRHGYRQGVVVSGAGNYKNLEPLYNNCYCDAIYVIVYNCILENCTGDYVWYKKIMHVYSDRSFKMITIR